MALTLEAAIVIPVTMVIAVSIMVSSVKLYTNIEMESSIESESMLRPKNNTELWSCEIKTGDGTIGWSKMISVNPVKEKMILDFVYDTVGMIKEMIPVFNKMEDLIFES